MFKYTGKHRCRNNTINCWLSWIGFLPSTSQKLYGFIKPNPGMTAIMRFQLMSSLLTSKARSGSDDISHSLPSIMITTTSSSCLSWFDFRSVPWYDLLYFFTTSVSVWINTGCFFNCSLPKYRLELGTWNFLDALASLGLKLSVSQSPFSNYQ